jgi:hypothetical protein
VTKKTWLWILAGIVGLLMVGCFAVVGTGIYVVSRQVQTAAADADAAEQAFEEVRDRFRGQRPLLVSGQEREGVEALRRRAAEYAGPTPENLRVMVWEERDQRLVNITIPFWLLRLGGSGSIQLDEFDFDRLRVDPRELERAGPLLLLDDRRDDAHVVVWTE